MCWQRAFVFREILCWQQPTSNVQDFLDIYFVFVLVDITKGISVQYVRKVSKQFIDTYATHLPHLLFHIIISSKRIDTLGHVRVWITLVAGNKRPMYMICVTYHSFANRQWKPAGYLKGLAHQYVCIFVDSYFDHHCILSQKYGHGLLFPVHFFILATVNSIINGQDYFPCTEIILGPVRQPWIIWVMFDMITIRNAIHLQ